MTDASDPSRAEPQSPCTKVCVIHPTENICVGCLRTLGEIAGWSAMSRDAKQALLDVLPERKSLLKRRRGGKDGRRDN